MNHEPNLAANPESSNTPISQQEILLTLLIFNLQARPIKHNPKTQAQKGNIYSNDDKRGGRLRGSGLTNWPNNFIADTGAIDLGFSGPSSPG